MKFKQLLYKFAKAAAVGAGAAISAALQQGLPMNKAALVALGVGVLTGAGHAGINAVEQALGWTLSKPNV